MSRHYAAHPSAVDHDRDIETPFVGGGKAAQFPNAPLFTTQAASPFPRVNGLSRLGRLG
jgi:hypothetical protein